MMKFIILMVCFYYFFYALLPLLMKIKYAVTSVEHDNKQGFNKKYFESFWLEFDTVHKGGVNLFSNAVLLLVFLTIYIMSSFYTSSDDKNVNLNSDSEYTEETYNDRSDYDEEYEEEYEEYEEEYDNSTGYGYVDSYERSDGTEVSGHYRTDPDEYEENNFSYEGNTSGDWDYEYHE